ncbi:MAG: TonB-dependent receptor, partial [Alphaproteobacteria bacterium]
LGGWGGFNFDFVGTWLEKLEVQSLPEEVAAGFPVAKCVGFHTDETCGEVPVPEWRHKFRTTWQTPIHLDVSATWRFFGATDSAVATSDFPEVHYLDLAARYQLFDNLALRAGVNNILDRDPPFTEVGAGFGNGNTYPQFYDATGRFFFFSATVDF